MKKIFALFLTILLVTTVGCTSDLENNNQSDSSQTLLSSDVAVSSEEASSSGIVSIKQDITTLQPLKAHFLDVGQGDSIFIELPNKETMLIDAGNNADGNKIVNYIKNKGYSTLNYLVATHPHADHIGGMATVVESLGIGGIYMPRATTTTKTYETLLTTIQLKGLKIKTAKAGVSIINYGDLKIDIVAPNSDSYKDLNDYSAVLKLTYKNNSFLLTGDSETVSESEITANVKADVLKVGHHGSNSSTSNAFLSKVSPKYAVISVGKGNSYGHPTADTLTKLNKAGISIYRTDEVGTIIFTSDGAKITVDKNASSIKENAPPQTTTSSKITSSTGGKDYDDTPITNVGYIGNKNTKKFHLPTCSSLPAVQNQVTFSSRDEAIASGYIPCGRCKP
ncbi:MBL fold metallo-hydrolase [Paludicola sp. MB14-C6]|uniref:ComEC/Rec2 family competence protein n=1 Tax=Paludihabitans sp. MB14-C6 TaxID=3070656 RepID=UPI0027DE5EF3|nr:MBL fold metallo-hydrolase [Paludicola sp. MB14-C6]WMJ24345.1 MBL fold metallo-hydrolase [Paludicola sp. MB14-C6]